LLEKASSKSRSFLDASEARPGSRGSSAAALAHGEEETQVHDPDNEDELFGDFQFRSFKTHK